MTMKKPFKIAGLVASFLAVSSIGFGATTYAGNTVRMTASGDTAFTGNSAEPPIKIKEMRIVTIAGAKSFILKAYNSAGTGTQMWERYNLKDDSLTTLTASTTATTTIQFPEGMNVPPGGFSLTTDDTSCSLYIVTDKVR